MLLGLLIFGLLLGFLLILFRLLRVIRVGLGLADLAHHILQTGHRLVGVGHIVSRHLRIFPLFDETVHGLLIRRIRSVAKFSGLVDETLQLIGHVHALRLQRLPIRVVGRLVLSVQRLHFLADCRFGHRISFRGLAELVTLPQRGLVVLHETVLDFLNQVFRVGHTLVPIVLGFRERILLLLDFNLPGLLGLGVSVCRISVIATTA